MKVTHIYHSGFAVEMQQIVLIFDWYLGELPDFDLTKRLFVFVSHSHGDHYSEQIWKLERHCRQTCYILDSTTAQDHKGDNVLHVQPGRSYEMEGLHFITLRSNDEGVAFLVQAEGREIYHAGDLNVWSWKDESDADNEYSERIYRGEMERLRGRDIDAAMVPLDPRLEERAPMGIDEFMRIVGCHHLFPMHYWNREKEAREYLADERIAPYAGKIHFEPVTEI